MSKQIETLELALEALEFFKGLSLSMKEIERAEKAITALQEALAKPEFREGYVPEPAQHMKTVIEMAREAGFDPHDMSEDFTCNLKDIERFAELVRADERKSRSHSLRYGEMELLLRRNHKGGLFEYRRHFSAEAVMHGPDRLVEMTARSLDVQMDHAIKGMENT